MDLSVCPVRDRIGYKNNVCWNLKPQKDNVGAKIGLINISFSNILKPRNYNWKNQEIQDKKVNSAQPRQNLLAFVY